MGRNCFLKIGSTEFDWNGIIPAGISLLFEASDYMPVYQEQEQWWEHKFASNCGKIVSLLGQQGIDLQLLRMIHFDYFSFDENSYRERIMHMIDSYLRHKGGKFSVVDPRHVERIMHLFMAIWFKRLNTDEEFSAVLKLRECSGIPRKPIILSELPAVQPTPIAPTTRLDASTFYREWLGKYLQEDPYTMHLTSEDDSLATGSDDLDFLYEVGLPIYASDSKTPVEFVFSELVDSDQRIEPDEVIGLLSDLRSELNDRTAWTSRAFGKLRQITSPSGQKDKTRKVAIIRDSKGKGDYLEDLATEIFSSQDGFTVKQKVRRPGEEIDLVILNKVDDPFWVSLQSPLILVECKNQTKKVEPKDLRNFEVKIQDRKSLCKLGIMISLSGFTKNCNETVARSGREGYRIILVDGKALQKHDESGMATAEWLEQMILEQ
jgi:Holliday junction resolvase-like predicted endonuclease